MHRWDWLGKVCVIEIWDVTISEKVQLDFLLIRHYQAWLINGRSILNRDVMEQQTYYGRKLLLKPRRKFLMN
jgi:hypothetical protein